MPKTVLITGSSSGIGKVTALHFQRQGWNVVATMRSPQNCTDLAQLPQVLCLPLDVTDADSMQRGVEQAIAHFGSIDVLINNAGYALVGAFEAYTPEQIQRQFDTNVMGLMAMTQQVLPHFRHRRQGLIVNIASVGGQMAFPLYSLYHASKWAVEGFSESLQYELRPFNIRVKLIEPGPIKTDFYDRSLTVAQKTGLTDYDAYSQKVLTKLNESGSRGSPPEVTARIIYRAVKDGSWRLRYPAGGNAGLLLFLHRFWPEFLWRQFVLTVLH